MVKVLSKLGAASTRAGRRGISLLEVAVAAVVLGAILTLAAQVVRWSAAEQRVALKRRAALEAASTVLDQITTREWSSITPQAAASIRLSAETTEFLHDPRLAVSVTNEGGTPAAKRIAVEVAWIDRGGGANQRVELSTWAFERKATK